MLAGLGAFVGFCVAIALLIEPAGVALAFLIATTVALLTQAAQVVTSQRLSPDRDLGTQRRAAIRRAVHVE